MERRWLQLATAINLPKSLRAFTTPISDRYRSEYAPRVMRETVIVALACFLIAIMAAALIVQFVP